MINAPNEVFPKTTEWKKVNIDLELNKEDSVVISTTQLIRLVSRPFDQKSQRKNCSKLWLIRLGKATTSPQKSFFSVFGVFALHCF